MNVCCLMPPLISDTKESWQINDLFLTELKNLMNFKLFNSEEILKKKKPNSNEFINFYDLEELFKVCINKLNEGVNPSLIRSATSRHPTPMCDTSLDSAHQYE